MLSSSEKSQEKSQPFHSSPQEHQPVVQGSLPRCTSRVATFRAPSPGSAQGLRPLSPRHFLGQPALSLALPSDLCPWPPPTCRPDRSPQSRQQALPCLSPSPLLHITVLQCPTCQATPPAPLDRELHVSLPRPASCPKHPQSTAQWLIKSRKS